MPGVCQEFLFDQDDVDASDDQDHVGESHSNAVLFDQGLDASDDQDHGSALERDADDVSTSEINSNADPHTPVKMSKQTVTCNGIIVIPISSKTLLEPL